MKHIIKVPKILGSRKCKIKDERQDIVWDNAEGLDTYRAYIHVYIVICGRDYAK